MAHPDKRDGKLTGSWVGEAPKLKKKRRFKTKRDAEDYEAFVKLMGSGKIIWKRLSYFRGSSSGSGRQSRAACCAASTSFVDILAASPPNHSVGTFRLR